MNVTHFHLLINHAPVFGVFFVIILLTAGFWLRSSTLKTTALCIALIASILTLPVMRSGDGAEHAVKNIPEITKASVHEHEESAELAQWTLYLSGLIALLGLIKRNNDSLYNKIALLLLLVSIVNFALVARAAYLGGYIRHAQEFGSQSNAPINSENDSH